MFTKGLNSTTTTTADDSVFVRRSLFRRALRRVVSWTQKYSRVHIFQTVFQSTGEQSDHCVFPGLAWLAPRRSFGFCSFPLSQFKQIWRTFLYNHNNDCDYDDLIELTNNIIILLYCFDLRFPAPPPATPTKVILWRLPKSMHTLFKMLSAAMIQLYLLCGTIEKVKQAFGSICIYPKNIIP